MNRIKTIITFIILLLLMAVFPYIPIELFHINIDNLSMGMKILYNFCCDLGFMIIVFMFYRNKLVTEFKDYFNNFISYFNLSFKYYIIGLIIMIVSNLLISNFFSSAVAGNEEAVRGLIHLYPVYMLFSTAIYAPFIEEIIFRRSIKDIIKSFNDDKYSKYIYIFISGFIFALMHIIGQTTSYLDYLFIIPYLSLGMAFAALYYRTDNIFTTIMLHALHNGVTVLLYIFLGV